MGIQSTIELVKEAIQAWRDGELNDFAAMQAIAMVVSPIEVSEADLEWAREWVEKHKLEDTANMLKECTMVTESPIVEKLCEAVELLDKHLTLYISDEHPVTEARDIVAAVITELTCE